MLETTVIDQDGQRVGSVELAADIFGLLPNKAVMHQALVRQMANARQGTSDTKNRTEVSGGGRKPWRQEGTGRARQGSTRSPQWKGGGVVFGPHPRSYHKDMPRKQRRLALRSALSAQAQAGSIRLLESFFLEKPSTALVARMLDTAEAKGRVLFVLGSHNEMLEKSARNIPHVKVVLASNLSVRDLLVAGTVVMGKDAVEHVVEVLR